jgi:hypothetical protein
MTTRAVNAWSNGHARTYAHTRVAEARPRGARHLLDPNRHRFRDWRALVTQRGPWIRFEGWPLPALLAGKRLSVSL